MSDFDLVWYRGVPWIRAALTSATHDGIADALTEVAREFRDAVQYDPARVPPAEVAWVERGGYTVGVNRDLVVVGHERPGKASSGVSGAEAGPEAQPQGGDRPKGRGPKDYDELAAWLEDEGYMVLHTGSGHRSVVDQRMNRRVTLNGTPGDKRSFFNDVAVCRRVLGIGLRRDK